jgi:ligand-binding sensor domain-containing protein
VVAADYGCNCSEFQPGEEVTKWDVSQETATRYTSADGLLEGQVRSVAAGPDGVVWFGATDGVSYFDGKGWGAYTTTHGLPGGYVVAIAAAPDGEVWGATMGMGVSHFDGKTWTTYTTADGLRSDWVKSIAIAPDGTPWLGGSGFVLRLDGTDWTSLTLPHGHFGDSDSAITSVAITSEGEMWFATDGDGVFHLDGEAWAHYLPSDGLASSTVTSIAAAPDGTLWFGTDSGVSRFDGETWTTVTSADGLVSNRVTVITVAPDGALWFGTDAGLSRYGLPD